MHGLKEQVARDLHAFREAYHALLVELKKFSAQPLESTTAVFRETPLSAKTEAMFRSYSQLQDTVQRLVEHQRLQQRIREARDQSRAKDATIKRLTETVSDPSPSFPFSFSLSLSFQRSVLVDLVDLPTARADRSCSRSKSKCKTASRRERTASRVSKSRRRIPPTSLTLSTTPPTSQEQCIQRDPTDMYDLL